MRNHFSLSDFKILLDFFTSMIMCFSVNFFRFPFGKQLDFFNLGISFIFQIW